MTPDPGPHRKSPQRRARWFHWRGDVQDTADDVRSIQEQLNELAKQLPAFEAQLWRASGRPSPPPGVDPLTGDEVDLP